jgi:hypothetical protein
MPTILVSNATELQNVNLDLAGVYQQTAAIDLTGVTFTPIGTGTGALRFAGSFDGAGFAITNLTINNRHGLSWGFSAARLARRSRGWAM